MWSSAIFVKNCCFLYLMGKKNHTSGWFKGAFGRKRENVWFLFKICSSSYVANSQDNLFQIFNDWKYKEALRNFRRTELSFYVNRIL